MSSPPRRVLGSQENVGVEDRAQELLLYQQPSSHHHHHQDDSVVPPLPPLPSTSRYSRNRRHHNQYLPHPEGQLKYELSNNNCGGGLPLDGAAAGVPAAAATAAAAVAPGESTDETAGGNVAAVGKGDGGGGGAAAAAVVSPPEQQQKPPIQPRSAFMCYTDARKKDILMRGDAGDETSLPPLHENGGNKAGGRGKRRGGASTRKQRERQLLKLVADEWRLLSDRERAHWDEEARNDKVRYVREKAEYKGPVIIPKRRAKKDPNAPKRPMSAFLKFSQHLRKQVKDTNPDMSNTDISRLLGETWRNLTGPERARYEEEEKLERAAYKVTIRKWREEQARADAATRTSHRDAVHKHGSRSRSKPAAKGPKLAEKNDAFESPEEEEHAQQTRKRDHQQMYLQPLPQQTPATQLLVDSFFDPSGIDIPPPPPPPARARAHSSENQAVLQTQKQPVSSSHAHGNKTRNTEGHQQRHRQQTVFRPYPSPTAAATPSSQYRHTPQQAMVSSSGSSSGGIGSSGSQHQQHYSYQHAVYPPPHHPQQHHRQLLIDDKRSHNYERGGEGKAAASSTSTASVVPGPSPPIRGTFRQFQAPPYRGEMYHHHPHHHPHHRPAAPGDRYSASEYDHFYGTRRYAPPPSSSTSSASRQQQQQQQQPPMNTNEEGPGTSSSFATERNSQHPFYDEHYGSYSHH